MRKCGFHFLAARTRLIPAALRGACRTHIPGALSISLGAVPGLARGLGHMAPTYVVGSRDRRPTACAARTSPSFCKLQRGLGAAALERVRRIHIRTRSLFPKTAPRFLGTRSRRKKKPPAPEARAAKFCCVRAPIRRAARRLPCRSAHGCGRGSAEPRRTRPEPSSRRTRSPNAAEQRTALP